MLKLKRLCAGLYETTVNGSRYTVTDVASLRRFEGYPPAPGYEWQVSTEEYGQREEWFSTLREARAYLSTLAQRG